MLNAAIADMCLALMGGDPLLDLLRRIYEYRGPGYDYRKDPEMSNLNQIIDLQNLELVRIEVQALGEYDCQGAEMYGWIVHITEEGLAELVLHGRPR